MSGVVILSIYCASLVGKRRHAGAWKSVWQTDAPASRRLDELLQDLRICFWPIGGRAVVHLGLAWQTWRDERQRSGVRPGLHRITQGSQIPRHCANTKPLLILTIAGASHFALSYPNLALKRAALEQRWST